MTDIARHGIAMAVALAGMAAVAQPVFAESEISVYGGVQSAFSSDVSGEDGDGVDFDFEADWEGKSFSMPPYWGVRYNWWRDEAWGLSIDFTHSKLYADDDTREDNGFRTLEFTDGLNALTVGVQRRFEEMNGFRPYVGAGIGIAYPHAEVRIEGSDDNTYEYTYGGFVAEIRGGASYQFADRWAAFAEYEGNYVALDVDLDGGGDLSSDVFTNALNLGVTFSF